MHGCKARHKKNNDTTQVIHRTEKGKKQCHHGTQTRIKRVSL